MVNPKLRRVPSGDRTLPENFVLKGVEEELRSLSTLSAQSIRECGSRRAITRLKSVNFNDQVPYDNVNVLYKDEDEHTWKKTIQPWNQSEDQDIPGFLSPHKNNGPDVSPSLRKMKRETFQPCPWIQVPEQEKSINILSLCESEFSGDSMNVDVFIDNNSDETDEAIREAKTEKPLGTTNVSKEVRMHNKPIKANDKPKLEAKPVSVNEESQREDKRLNYLRRGTLYQRQKGLSEKAFSLRKETESKMKEKLTRPQVYESKSLNVDRRPFNVDSANGIGGGIGIAFARGNFDRELLAAMKANLENPKNRKRFLAFQRAEKEEKERIEKERKRKLEENQKMANSIIKVKVQIKHLSLRQKQKLEQKKKEEEERLRKEEEEKKRLAMQKKTMSRGKRLWLKAFRKIRMMKTMKELGSAAKCETDQFVDEETGKDVMMLTTCPRPKPEAEESEKKKKKRRKKRKKRKGSGGEWEEDETGSEGSFISEDEHVVEPVTPSVTLRMALTWFGDYELSADDRLLQMAEKTGAKEWENIRAKEELERWLALPEPVVEITEMDAEVTLLECRLAASRFHIWNQAKTIAPEQLTEQPDPISLESDDEANSNFFGFWIDSENPKSKALRHTYLEEEILIAFQDTVVLEEAKAVLGAQLEPGDNQSRSRERRQLWRDFREWFFNSSARKAFLTYRYDKLRKAWDSHWATWIRYQQQAFTSQSDNYSFDGKDLNSEYSDDFESFGGTEDGNSYIDSLAQDSARSMSDFSRRVEETSSLSQLGMSGGNSETASFYSTFSNFGNLKYESSSRTYKDINVREIIQSFEREPEEVLQEYERDSRMNKRVIWNSMSEEEQNLELKSAICNRLIRSFACADGVSLDPYLNKVISKTDMSSVIEEVWWVAFKLWYPAHKQARQIFLSTEVQSAARDFVQERKVMSKSILDSKLQVAQPQVDMKKSLCSEFYELSIRLLETMQNPILEHFKSSEHKECTNFSITSLINEKLDKKLTEKLLEDDIEHEAEILAEMLVKAEILHKKIYDLSQAERIRRCEQVSLEYNKKCNEIRAAGVDSIMSSMKNIDCLLEDVYSNIFDIEKGVVRDLEIARLEKVAAEMDLYKREVLIKDIADMYFNQLRILSSCTNAKVRENENQVKSNCVSLSLMLRKRKKSIKFKVASKEDWELKKNAECRKYLLNEASEILKKFSMKNESEDNEGDANDKTENESQGASAELDIFSVLDSFMIEVSNDDEIDRLNSISKQNIRGFLNLKLKTELNEVGIVCENAKPFLYSPGKSEVAAEEKKQHIYGSTISGVFEGANSPTLIDFENWYFESTELRFAYLSNSNYVLTEYTIEMKKRGEKSKGAGVFDEEESLELPPLDENMRRRMRLFEIQGWYSESELNQDDMMLITAEKEAQKALEKELEEMHAKMVRDLREKIKKDLEQESDYDSDIDDENGISVFEKKKRFRFTDKVKRKQIKELKKLGWKNGTGLDNGDEEYEANWEANEAKRLFLEAEEARRKEELQKMRREEDVLRRWLVDQRRQKLRGGKEKALNDMVFQQRQDEEERRNDPAGLCVRERLALERANMLAQDTENVERWRTIDIFVKNRERETLESLQREQSDMEFEDYRSMIEQMEAEQLLQLEIETAKREKHDMQEEDLMSYLARPIWDEQRRHEAEASWLEKVAFAPFDPYFKDKKEEYLTNLPTPVTDKAVNLNSLAQNDKFVTNIRGKQMKLNLSNKFQQVLGIPSSCRASADTNSVGYTRKYRSLRSNKEKCANVSRPARYDSINYNTFIPLKRKNTTRLNPLDSEYLSQRSAMQMSRENFAILPSSNKASRRSKVSVIESVFSSDQKTRERKNKEDLKYEITFRVDNQVLRPRDQKPKFTSSMFDNPLSEFSLEEDSLSRPHSCPVPFEIGTSEFLESYPGSLLENTSSDNLVVRLPQMHASEVNASVSFEHITPWQLD